MNYKHVSQRLFHLFHRWKRELYACTHVTNVHWMQMKCAIYVPSSSLSSSLDSVSSTVHVGNKARHHAKRNLKQFRLGRICVWFILFLIIQRCFELSGYVPSNGELIMDDEFVKTFGSVFLNFIGASARRQCGNKTSSQPLNRNSTPVSPEYGTRTIKS